MGSPLDRCRSGGDSFLQPPALDERGSRAEMDFSQLTRLRKTVAGVAAVLCLVFCAALIDGLTTLTRQPVNHYSVVRGESAGVTGPVPENAKFEELRAKSDSGQVGLSFEAAQTGFWFGGRMWRGKVTTSPSCEPGEYTIDVYAGESAEKPSTVIKVKVFATGEELERNSGAMISMWFAVSPWKVAGSFAFALLICFGAVYLISGKRDAAFAAMGKAEIYKVETGPDGCEVYFGLGTEHGVHPGMRLTLHDEQGVPLGPVKVLQSTGKDSVARVEQSTAAPRAGFLVSRD